MIDKRQVSKGAYSVRVESPVACCRNYNNNNNYSMGNRQCQLETRNCNLLAFATCNDMHT